MNGDKDKSYSEIMVLLGEVAILAILVFFSYTSGTADHTAFYLLITTVVVYSVTWSFFYFSYKRKTRNMYRMLLKLLKSIALNKEFVPPLDIPSEISEALEELETLNGLLKHADDNMREIQYIVNSIASNNKLSAMMNDILPRILSTTKSSCGAFYLANNSTGKLELRSSRGFGRGIYEEFDISMGEGLVGSAAEVPEITVIHSLPDNPVLNIKGITGDFVPAGMMFVPILSSGKLLGILVLASMNRYTQANIDICNLFKYYVAIAVVNCIAFEKAERSKNETVFQNNLIQELNKELKLKFEDKSNFIRNIVNSVKEYAIYVLDKDGKVLEWNRGAELMYGLSEQQAVGQMISMIYTDEEIGSGKVRARIDCVLKTGSFSDKGWKRKADGTMFYSDINVTALYNENGEIIGMTSVTKDITHELFMEIESSYLKKVLDISLESGNDAVLALNGQGIIESYSAESKELLGVDEPEGIDMFSLVGLNEETRNTFLANTGNHLEFSAIMLTNGKNLHFTLTAVTDKMINFKKFVVRIKNSKGGDRGNT